MLAFARNWKTTVASLGLAGYAVFRLAQYALGEDTDYAAVSEAVLAALAAFGLAVARDADNGADT